MGCMSLPTPASDPDRDAIAATDPATDLGELARIAAERPDLHPLLASNPSTYADLLVWLDQVGGEQVHTALAARREVADSPVAQPARPAPSPPQEAPAPVAPVLTSEAGPAPAVSAAAVPGHRPRRRLLVVGAAAAVVLLVVGGVAGYALGRSGAYSGHAERPGLGTVTNVSSLGEDPALAPLDRAGSMAIEHDGLTLVRLTTDTADAVVALDPTSTSAYPAWMAPLPAEVTSDALSCWMEGDGLVCNDAVTIDLTTGAATPSGPEAAAGQATTSASPLAPSAGGSTTVSSLLEQTGTGTGTGTDTSTDSNDALVPLTVDGTSLVTADGTAVPGLTLTDGAPVWAAPTSLTRTVLGIDVGSDDAWAVSDGTVLAVVRDSTLLWSMPLDASAAAMTGLGTSTPPRWIVSDDALVTASPDGVTALSPDDGATLWSVDTPMTSWGGDGDSIAMVNGTDLALVTFASDTPVPDRLPAPAVTPAPTWDDLADATLDVPADCASFALQPGTEGPAAATFTDGVSSSSTQNLPSQSGSVTVGSVQPGVFDRRPVALATLECFGGGSYAYDSLAVYDADLRLIGSLEPWKSRELGVTQELQMEDVTTVGNTVTLTVPQIVLAGDQDCHACAGSGTAHVTATWADSRLTITDTVYDTPNGEVRVPDTASVQKVYDAVSAGDDVTAAEHMSPDLVASLDARWGKPPTTLRAVHFPPGATITGCHLAGPADNGTMYLPEGKIVAPGSLTPGDVVCPIASDQPGSTALTTVENGSTSWHLWLVLRGKVDGSVEIIELGRNFSGPSPSQPVTGRTR